MFHILKQPHCIRPCFKQGQQSLSLTWKEYEWSNHKETQNAVTTKELKALLHSFEV